MTTVSITQSQWHQDTTVTLQQTEHDPVLTICITSSRSGPELSPFPVLKSSFLTYTQTLQITSIIKYLVQPEWPKQPWASFLHCLPTWPYGFSEMLNNTPVPFAFNSSPGVSYLWVCLFISYRGSINGQARVNIWLLDADVRRGILPSVCLT